MRLDRQDLIYVHFMYLVRAAYKHLFKEDIRYNVENMPAVYFRFLYVHHTFFVASW